MLSGLRVKNVLSSISACGPPEEDELYENHILDTNMIYKMEDNKLVPVDDCWGAQPKYKMLQSNQVGGVNMPCGVGGVHMPCDDGGPYNRT